MYSLLAEGMRERDASAAKENAAFLNCCDEGPAGRPGTAEVPSDQSDIAEPHVAKPNWAELSDSIIDSVLHTCNVDDMPSLRLVCHRWHESQQRSTAGLAPTMLNTMALLKASPCMEGLCLSRAMNMDDSIKEIRLLSSFSNLRKLDLSGCVLPKGSMASIGEIHTLTSLDLSRMPFLDNDDLALLRSTSASNLENLCLDNCTGVSGREAIAFACRHPLQELSLNGCETLGDCDVAVLACLTSLQKLNLAGCVELSHTAVEILLGLERLRELSLAGCKGLSGQSAINALAGLSWIESLNLSHCSALPGSSLCSLSSLSMLTHLDLGMTGVTDSALFEATRGMSKLKCLGLAWCDRLTDDALAAVSNCTALTTLDLTGCSHICSRTSLEALIRLKQLSTLRLGHSGITASAVQPIYAIDSLTSLSVSGMQGFGSAELALLQGLPCLQVLEAGNCKAIDDNGLAALSALTSLLHLSIPRCSWISDTGLAFLQSLVRLHSLDLRKCQRITDNGLVFLFAALPSLRSVDASSCFQIKDHETAIRAAMCKNVKLTLS